jgi:CRP-like cAMP-binding protein
MALFDSQARSATVTAITPVTCIEINSILFKQHLAKIPPYMRSLYQILAERLRETNKKQTAGDPKELGKRVVFMLNLLFSMTKPDNFDYVSLPWPNTVEAIAFVMNQTPEMVDRVMTILSLSPLANTKQDYEFGRLFQTNDPKSFQRFSDYCRQQYMKRLGVETGEDLTDLTIRKPLIKSSNA